MGVKRELLRSLARECGILEGYHDIWGEYHPTEAETEREVLRAMGLCVDSARDVEAELLLRRKAPMRRLCEPVVVLPEGADHRISLSAPSRAGRGEITVRLRGRSFPIRETRHAIHPQDPDRARVTLVLPDRLPPGVHDAEIDLVFPTVVETARTRLVVAPNRGYEPEPLDRGARLWGVNLPLYGIRSRRNWGIGDLEDLCHAVGWAAELGADLVGLLPLHALFNVLPHGVSPYFPSSRIFLNPIYVAVDRVAEAAEPEVRSLIESDSTRLELDRLRSSQFVDYDEVWALKEVALRLCYGAFVDRHLESPDGSTGRGLAFDAWRRSEGQALEHFATFSALRDHLARDQAGPRPWQEWPEGFSTPDAHAVQEFRRNHAFDVGFYAYLQWIAEEQLARARDRARRLGMAVGLYLDVALGVDPCGADAWVHQDVLALGASAGAPPDPFSLMGQRWGVPPVIPERHRETGYSFFLETLRRNARRTGALRMDHVLALWRLFWVPGDLPASRGAYVTDDSEELLSLLRLISREENCLIVGEDLGTIPPEVREGLTDSGFFSYRVLIFEKDHDGRYRRPAQLPKQALVSVATHDLPPLDGFWTGRDLEVKRALGRYPTPEAERDDAECRRWDRLRLLEALGEEGLLPERIEPAHEIPENRLDDLAEAVHAYLARAPSALLLANLDDLLGEKEMQNLPGTLAEHPNWRRKVAVPLEAWGECRRARRIAEAIGREGRR